MKDHHTKNKGDKAVGFVIADLMKKDVHVALPISEHLPFDLIAITPHGLFRVSVKYRKMLQGSIIVQMRSSWADSKGCHTSQHSKNDYDWIAVYCPDTQECYYVSVSELSKGVHLRVVKPLNNQNTGIKFASSYTSLPYNWSNL